MLKYQKLIACRFTRIHRSDWKHIKPEEADPVRGGSGVPRPIRDREALQGVPENPGRLAGVLHRQARLPPCGGAHRLRRGQEVDEGEEDPHWPLAEDQLHAHEVVRQSHN